MARPRWTVLCGAVSYEAPTSGSRATSTTQTSSSSSMYFNDSTNAVHVAKGDGFLHVKRKTATADGVWHPVWCGLHPLRLSRGSSEEEGDAAAALPQLLSPGEAEARRGHWGDRATDTPMRRRQSPVVAAVVAHSVHEEMDQDQAHHAVLTEKRHSPGAVLQHDQGPDLAVREIHHVHGQGKEPVSAQRRQDNKQTAW